MCMKLSLNAKKLNVMEAGKMRVGCKEEGRRKRDMEVI